MLVLKWNLVKNVENKLNDLFNMKRSVHFKNKIYQVDVGREEVYNKYIGHTWYDIQDRRKKEF